MNPKAKDFDELHEEIEDKNDRLISAGRPRVQYARMRTHKELAAQVLAVGGTQRMAAKYAGVSSRQVKKYWTEPDFRTRIEELRTIMTSKIRGKIMKEIDRRTNPGMIQNLEVMDLVRLLDRTTGEGGRGMITVNGDVNVNKYEGILAAIVGVVPSGDGEDFPQYGDSGITISGTSTPVD